MPLGPGRNAAPSRGRPGFASAGSPAFSRSCPDLRDVCRSRRADDPVKGEATFSSSGGYARLVLKLAEDVESEVFTAGSIIIIRFKRPVDIPVDQLSDAVPDYVGSARRDPDGSATPVAAAPCHRQHHDRRRAGLCRFPARWLEGGAAVPAGRNHSHGPHERAAERALRLQRATADARKRPPVRVRASVQPTLSASSSRCSMALAVSSVLNDQKLTRCSTRC